MINFKEHKRYTDGLLKTADELVDIAKSEGRERIFRFLSFGGGTQSSHLLEACIRKEMPHNYDGIIWSDTGSEPAFIHNQVEWWIERMKSQECETPFIISRHNSMERGIEEMLFRYIFTDYQRFQLPLYFNKVVEETGEIVKGGLMPRQCTGDFKIIPAQQAARNFVKRKLIAEGVLKSMSQNIPKNVGIIMDIGFSLDEINRVGGYVSHQSKYIYLAYPLIEKGLTTKDSIDFLAENNFPSQRSRCYLCPFNCSGDRARDIGMDWQEIIDYEPVSFLKAVFFDEELRKIQATGTKRMLSIPYFHYSRTPLKEFYKESYERVKANYEHELNDWVTEWHDFLYKKYISKVA